MDERLREVRSPANGDVAVNEDIALALDQIEAGERRSIPDHDLLVGGFPCQDYSVAKTLNLAAWHRGQEGRPLVADLQDRRGSARARCSSRTSTDC